MEQIQGLPGKTEAVSNVILNELDNSVKKTQVIILSPTREAAQKMYMLVSAAAAALSITTHLSIGGTNVREDGLLLKERPHVVVGTIGRLYSMLERKTINTGDISFLCVEGIQFLLGSKYENELSMFCEQLPNDLVVVLLSTKIRYKGHHDFGKLFTRKPLYFLVEEDPAPDPSLIPHDPVPIDVEKNRDYGAAAIMVRLIYLHQPCVYNPSTCRTPIAPVLVYSVVKWAIARAGSLRMMVWIHTSGSSIGR